VERGKEGGGGLRLTLTPLSPVSLSLPIRLYDAPPASAARSLDCVEGPTHTARPLLPSSRTTCAPPPFTCHQSRTCERDDVTPVYLCTDCQAAPEGARSAPRHTSAGLASAYVIRHVSPPPRPNPHLSQSVTARSTLLHESAPCVNGPLTRPALLQFVL